jgi:UPF0716 protein FxsA
MMPDQGSPAAAASTLSGRQSRLARSLRLKPMLVGLFFLFIAIPLIEIALLIKVGQWIGFWPTLAIVVGSAVLGASVLHRQGLIIVQRAYAQMARGRPPVRQVADAVFLMLAGSLLLAPGLITDVAGLLLLIPTLRSRFAAWSIRRLMAAGITTVHHPGPQGSRPGPSSNGSGRPAPGAAADGPVIDGEFERIDERTIDPERARRAAK